MPIKKAGAIVLDQSKKHVLMVHRHSKDDWSFPKGHLEPKETSEQAAIREVGEETGFSIQIISTLPELIYHTRNEKQVELSMFLAVAVDRIQEPEVGSDSKWTAVSEVNKRLSYENLRDYWRSVSHLIFR